jgi:hypothetical protein
MSRMIGARKSRNALFGSLQKSATLSVDGFQTLRSIAQDLYQSFDTPISLSCEILLRYGELDQLVKKSVSPHNYNDPFKFRDDYQAVGFLKKTPLEISGVDRLSAAKQKFYEAEEACRLTNARLRQFVATPERVSSEIRQILSSASRKIHRLLGEFCSSEWLSSCRFGPGVFTHTLARGLTSVYDKLQVAPSVSNDFWELGSMLVMSSPSWSRSVTELEHEGFHPFVSKSDLCLVPGNRVAFVPKTAIIDRGIAIEPLLNIYAQLGVGRMIRNRLGRFTPVDLNDQTANQQAARIGSLDGSLATIDLSSASDTVATELVRFLLPEDWYHVLDLIRSKVGFLDEKWLRYEKFSSMGNGATFELESLIFWALSSSVVSFLGEDPSRVRVYGDDIIVPSTCFSLLADVLEFCGFSLNGAKSFHDGYFRESCGKDYFAGYEVRPFFQKEVPESLEKLFRLCNGIRRLGSRRNNHYGCDARLFPAWSSALRAIPRSVAKCVRVPAHAGDSDGWKALDPAGTALGNRGGPG